VESKKIERYVPSALPVFSHGILTIFREWNAAVLQLISDLGDMAAPSTALGLVNLDDGIIGLAGTMSSLIGLYSQWEKVRV
jgi:hypothetical protein